MLTENLPRVPIAHPPTPLEEMPRLSEALGGPRLLVKRDDQTGLATGGNKARSLEFLVADALEIYLLDKSRFIRYNQKQCSGIGRLSLARCNFSLKKSDTSHQWRFQLPSPLLPDMAVAFLSRISPSSTCSGNCSGR